MAITAELAFAEGLEDAEGLAAAEALNLTNKKKLEAAIRAHIKKLDREYDQRRMREIREHLDRTIPDLTQARNAAWESEKQFREFLDRQKKIFTKDEYKLILMVLHPDGDRSQAKREQAFRLFNSKKFEMTGEK
jgi:hypothetical protein